MNIQGVGIAPDFHVERLLPPTEQMQWFTKYYGREKALSNTIKMGDTQADEQAKKQKEADKSTPKRWIERAKEMLKTDNQLREAINLLNLLDIFHTLCPNKIATREKALELLKQSHISTDSLDIEEIKS